MDRARGLNMEKIKDFFKRRKKIVGITIGIVLIILIIAIIFGEKNKVALTNRDSLEMTFPGGSDLVEITMGTYYKDSQKDYCKIKLPGNYSGWAMYLTAENENINFEMATSQQLNEAIGNGLLEKEEAIQQFNYNNSGLVEGEQTDLFATIYTADQITYDGMKTQLSGATKVKEIGENAFYSKGDEKYTDIDFTMYYKLSDDVTLQLSYKGPSADEFGIEKIANYLYEQIEVIK